MVTGFDLPGFLVVGNEAEVIPDVGRQVVVYVVAISSRLGRFILIFV